MSEVPLYSRTRQASAAEALWNLSCERESANERVRARAKEREGQKERENERALRNLAATPQPLILET